MRKNGILAAVMVVCLGFTAAVSPLEGLFPVENTLAQAAESGNAQGIQVSYHTQEEIRAYVKKNGATMKDALTFAEEPVTTAPYDFGSLSEETQQSALAMLNQIRYIAGLSDTVTLDDSYTEKVQAAALANYANKTLSHSPAQPDGMSDEMYQLACAGAGSANIAWASWRDCSLNHTLVMSWMEDGNSGNIPMVGHRRWILNPSMGKTGFGAVSGANGTYSAMYSFDRSNSSAGEYGVMWPAQNMPTEYFNSDFPWSVSMGKNVQADDITVTLTRQGDGKEWKFSSDSADGYFNVNNQGYGQSGCIIFRPDDLTKYSDGDSFEVTVDGLTDGVVSYTVDFFTLQEKATETPLPTKTPSGHPGSTTEPTEMPTVNPGSSAEPTGMPTTNPGSTTEPTGMPTVNPGSTTEPTGMPIVNPGSSAEPTGIPTVNPGSSAKPTVRPSATSSPKINPTASPSAAPKLENGGKTTVHKPSKPSRVKIIKAKSKRNGKIVVQWKKVSGTKKYHVQFAGTRNFTGEKSDFYVRKSKALLPRKFKKTCYVRVRAYKVGNAATSYNTVFGKWSKVKKVRG